MTSTNPATEPAVHHRMALVLGPWVGLVLGVLVGQESSAIGWTTGVTIWCAIWWIFEPIPIAVTALLPLGLFPAVGVLSADEVGQSLGDPLILLMLGGFMLSTAMERSGAHRRIAIGMVRLVGNGSDRRLILGFMAASALLSMWISNAATVLMLLPIALAAIAAVPDDQVRKRVLLSIAYAAGIGGINTPIGSPPNLVFLKFYNEATGIEVTFVEWMGFALPVSLLMLPLAAMWLTRGIRAATKHQLPDVGRWRREEVRTLIVFAVTAALWVTRKQPFGGWSSLSFGGISLEGANDASVALLAVIVMFLVPNGETEGPRAREKLLDWKTASSIQWGILLLFGGGIAIAKAFGASGLNEVLGEKLAAVAQLPVVAMIAATCFCVTFLTEVTSNTATTTLLMPILAATAIAANVDPKLLMVPAAISASFAFMLPVATPTNAIVFGGSDLTVRDMAREGVVLNFIGIAVVTLRCMFL